MTLISCLFMEKSCMNQSGAPHQSAHINQQVKQQPKCDADGSKRAAENSQDSSQRSPGRR